MGIILTGASTNDVDTTANNELKVALSTTAANSGFVRIAGGDTLPISSSGSFSGAPATGSGKGRLKVGVDTLEFYDPVDGNAINNNLWQSALTTANFTIVQANSFLTLNSAASVVASSGSMIFTIKQFQRITTFPMVARWLMKVSNRSITNATMEIGFISYATMATSAIATITDGSYFRFTSAGLFAVTTFNGVDTISSVISDPGAAVNSYMIVRKSTGVDFYVGDTLVATVVSPTINPGPANTSRIPFAARTWTISSTASAAPQIALGEVVLFEEDLDNNKTWGEQLSLSGGRGAYQNPVTTFLQTANHANSASPTSATLSNTAAGYTTFGGRYQFAAPAGAATDFALFAFQVPAGFQLVVKQVRITAMNTGAAVATTATILDWSVATNSSAVSLATADAVATSGVTQTWSPRRIPLGMHGFIVAAGIGATSPDVSQIFDPPLVVDQNRFFHVIVQIPVGTATTSQVIRGDVVIVGYFE